RQCRRLARLPAPSHRRHRRRSQPLHRSRPRYRNNELLLQPFGVTAMVDRCCTRGCPTLLGKMYRISVRENRELTNFALLSLLDDYARAALISLVRATDAKKSVLWAGSRWIHFRREPLGR